MAEIDEGSVIGNYRVIRPLGQGGMGTVYEVEHLELGTHYALKTFTFDPDSDANHALKTKFLEEGKLLARLKHPNLTHVFDLGFEDGTQMPYFVMDLVTYEDGESYTVEDIELKDIDEDMVYRWFKQLASALDYIHGEGIVHRDIKPSNLLVDKDLNVVLTDFGISRIFGQKIKSEVEATRTVVTKTGRGKLVLGTEHYIAPEVADGEEATPKSDAYSLGVMLIRWLTGFYYGDNPGAIALLSRKKYRWLNVIPRLVAPAARRPDNYTELLKQVKPDKPTKPAAAPEPPPAEAGKKPGRLFAGVVAAVAGVMAMVIVGGVGFFGWGIWRQSEESKREQQAQIDAIRRQVEEKAAREKAEREQLAAEQARKEAEEKRIAEEKRKAREAKLAEQRRIDESRTKIEKQDPGKLAARETPVTEIKKETPEPEKPKAEFVVVKGEDAEDAKDYGPIPDRKYEWLKIGNAASPQPVMFEMANGAKIDLVPQKAGVFFMSNNPDRDGKACHKVTLTRPFWMSKFCITPNQWRDFAPHDCENLRPLENALGENLYVNMQYTRTQAFSFCTHLTRKYAKQLPSGYEFRLPTEAEWEYALDIENTMRLYQNKPTAWLDWVSPGGQIARDTLTKLKKGPLASFGEWEDGWGNAGWSRKYGCMVGGRAKPHASGICDMWNYPHMVIDEVDKYSYPRYNDEETDPVHVTVKDIAYLSRECYKFRSCNTFDSPFHLVLAPVISNLTAISNVESIRADVRIPQKTYDWYPEKVPNKISHAREIKFKMACGEEMIFCTCPKGRFLMSNHRDDVQKFHKVELTYPFWFSKYCVTAKQWREWGQYDCEGYCRIIEKCLPDAKICKAFGKAQWTAFCAFLTERYKNQLPNGYVFRLPTEAEWEYAAVANVKNGTIYDVSDDVRYLYGHSVNRDAFRVILKKNKILRDLGEWDDAGKFQDVIVGGRLSSNAWGVSDIRCWGSLTLDSYFAQYGAPMVMWVQYNKKEIDPLHLDGRVAGSFLTRDGSVKGAIDGFGRAFAHIVVGPDLEKGRHEVGEVVPFPEFDFGGKYIGNHAKVTKLSSEQPGSNLNTPEKWLRLLSRDPIPKDESICSASNIEARGFHTKKEAAPWIEIEFDGSEVLAGISAEIYYGIEKAHHLRVWTSEDGKRWHEFGSENRLLWRYRFDFSNKSVKAKYIRIGRERGFRDNYFWLHKILIYGKK